ncbi:MAG: hypothetical protein LBM08_03890 [Dysgonamonadaceae bacterium]|jgi:hypothetical protein|nr:hypothetical protein [Dysgonamonadaceae bacterium]
MADNNLTYKLDLAGNLWDKLRVINVANEKQLETWSKVQRQVNSANGVMGQMGKSIGSMNQRIAALRAQKEWIPATNREAIRATNREIKQLEKEITKLNALEGGKIKGWLNDLQGSIPGLRALTNPLTLASVGIYKLTSYIGASKQAYMEESVEVQKLSTVMRNTMGARQDQINSILDLASAQQKLGVIGDEVQYAGAQELATYLQYPDSLKKIIPAMNDMLAQQYGLNASQEQAQQIATMLGKVMQGQTGALSRYGYNFTKAQEAILKHGKEAQRAAVLFDVVSESVGGVNKALAQTPEGKLKQQANNMGDLQERVGKLVVAVESAFSPIIGRIGDLMDKIISKFEDNKDQIMQVVSVVSDIVIGAIEKIWSYLKWFYGLYKGFLDGLREGNIFYTAIAGAIGGIIAALVLYKAWMTIVTVATSIWSAVLWIASSPITLIIAGIAALIAIIAYCCYKIEGWGSLWDGVTGFMKNSFRAYVESVKLYWSTFINGFMIGLDHILTGWYKFKEAVGMGDSEENKAALSRINADIEKRQKAIIDGARKVAEYGQKARESLAGIEMSWNSEKSLADIGRSIKEKMGIGTNESVQSAVNDPLGATSGGGNSSSGGSRSNEAITTGGTRNTTINISVGKFFESMIFNGGVRENKESIQRDMAEVLSRILGVAETAAS